MQEQVSKRQARQRTSDMILWEASKSKAMEQNKYLKPSLEYTSQK